MLRQDIEDTSPTAQLLLHQIPITFLRSLQRPIFVAIMAISAMDPFFQGTTGKNTRGLLRVIILCTIAAAALSSRLFSVISMYQLLDNHAGPFLDASMGQ